MLEAVPIYKAVIFDLDGTLFDSQIDFQEMKRRSISLLEKSGVPPGLLSEEMLNYEIEGLAVEALAQTGISAAEIKRVLQRVAEIMDQIELEALEGASIFPGVVETLEELKNRGFKIGIITRSCREYALGLIEKFGLQRLIDGVAARDDVLEPKPAAEHALYLMEILGVKPSETVLAGDHPMDALCAEKAGIRFFLISTADTDLKTFKPYNYEALQNIRQIVNLLTPSGDTACA
ncbi:HAD hydrolase-like protein [Candidatus Bathyarchaeota archaeon]|nr:HAD hydrolase-like protein [Candidatus Bathyarchaeota archaeon]NIR13562.1 HAD hydrolase-like protein [Desulfobacterales bacterium]NIU81194.1 HAD hydrolase-like protein [Candidatus Bathyarchaeota archaeon]NIV67836.1 HAD hydrolase-like protein [Candidatus Bathyarchaeota archaeon]NIW15867.1 HAD hydrolase-like protein [Candidatus Bathyarchaeota archaeon]